MNKEILVISNLRKNSRMTLTQMSRATRIPISTLFDMIRRSDKILRHTCIPDFEKLGYRMRALISIKTHVAQKEEFQSFLLSHPNLNSLYRVNNGFDFMFEVVYPDLYAVEKFMEDLEAKFSIECKQVNYIINDLARETFFSNPQKCELFNL